MVEYKPVTFVVASSILVIYEMLSSLLFYFFSFFGLISSFFVIASLNPVYSVLFLVSTFICFSCLIFSLGLDFIPIILIIVYVGAVAILFLFVVMMLDIKIAIKNNDINKFAPFLIVCFCFCFINVEFFSTNFYVNESCFFYSGWFSFFDNSIGVKLLGYVLFVDFYIYLLLSGIILLLALIGTVVLTLTFKNDLNYQVIGKQMARDVNSAVFFVR